MALAPDPLRSAGLRLYAPQEAAEILREANETTETGKSSMLRTQDNPRPAAPSSEQEGSK
jgi:hypothetical protein